MHSNAKVNELLKKDLPLLCGSTPTSPADKLTQPKHRLIWQLAGSAMK